MKKPRPSQRALHLQVSPGTKRRVDHLIDTVSAYAFKGAQHPEAQDEIEIKYRRTHKRFLAFLANLEQKAGRIK